MKLQSALEYLTTYGWAILIISIVIVALFTIINLTAQPQQICVLPAGFSCSGFYMQSFTPGTENVVINLQQATQYPIQVTAVGCSNPVNLGDTYALSTPVTLQVGGNYIFTAQCFSNGTAYVGTIGKTYGGYFVVNYTNAYTGFPNTVYGRINVPIIG